MRELKFRVWNIEEKKMIDFTFSDIGKANFLYEPDYHFVWKSGMKEPTKITNTENPIMQFTGLKDKSKREIYEGDILLNTKYKNKFKIEWAKEHDYCGFVTINLEDGFRNLFLAKNFTNCKVVGNVYETPELIKK